MAHYFDTSALVKLVAAEAESPALLDWMRAGIGEPVSSDLARAELYRAVRRVAPPLLVRAREVLDGLTLLELTSSIFDAAGRLEPAGLRTLDAIHLASALDLGDDLESVVTYDDRLADAAARNGVAVTTPR